MLLQGAEELRPHLPPVREMLAAVMDVLEATQRCAEGGADYSESARETEKLERSFPDLFPAPPAWFPSDLANQVSSAIRAAESDHPDAAAELIAWIRKECPKRRGRPADQRLTDIYREAARMRLARKSWQQIANRLCPIKRDDTEHRCSEVCRGRIRQGARRYLK